jgi:hypothetical protein
MIDPWIQIWVSAGISLSSFPSAKEEYIKHLQQPAGMGQKGDHFDTGL